MIVDMKKIWMAYVNALRPTENHSSASTRTRGHMDASSEIPDFHVPYDQGMTDRFVPVLATR